MTLSEIKLLESSFVESVGPDTLPQVAFKSLRNRAAGNVFVSAANEVRIPIAFTCNGPIRRNNRISLTGTVSLLDASDSVIQEQDGSLLERPIPATTSDKDWEKRPGLGSIKRSFAKEFLDLAPDQSEVPYFLIVAFQADVAKAARAIRVEVTDNNDPTATPQRKSHPIQVVPK